MSDRSTASSAPGRNDFCPCGSGLRYKRCCGCLEAAPPAVPAAPQYVGWDALRADQRAALWRTMQTALAAQKEGQLAVARGLYEEVVARAPYTGDAVHMLGVVHLQEGDLETAEALLRRALDLMPQVEAIRQNLQLLKQRKRDTEGIYSLRAIVAIDMLRLLGATGRLSPVNPGEGFLGSASGTVHVVVPGDILNGGANQDGVALVRQLAAVRATSLWSDPRDRIPRAEVPGAVEIDVAGGVLPRDGTLAVFGINPCTLDWLADAAPRFDSIVIALDVHDPEICVDVFDRLPPAMVSRVRLVARSAAVLADLGVPGAVDTMVFGAVKANPRAREHSWKRPRLAVFIAPVRSREERLRWEMLEWLRGQGAFLRVLYPGRLPSPHIANDDEHLAGIVGDWDDWWNGLDGLFFWGAEGRMRQYDRLVFEALEGGLAIVADGFGDYAPRVAARCDGALFFDAQSARKLCTDWLTGACDPLSRFAT